MWMGEKALWPLWSRDWNDEATTQGMLAVTYSYSAQGTVVNPSSQPSGTNSGTVRSLITLLC